MDDLQKMEMVLDLLDEVEVPEPLMMYFDYDSTKLLDKKIDVLQELKDGTPFEEIEGAESIFELLPTDQHWD